MKPPYKAAVSFSSGITSWCAAKRYIERNGPDGVVLVFADTLIEDEDNYRFLNEAVENLGVPLIRLADGRTPNQVMSDEKIIGNSRFDPCSKILKRQLIARWTKKNCDFETDLVIGINWDEYHRFERINAREKNFRYVAPMCDAPYLNKFQQLAWAEREGIKPPRMYSMGFAHANCGGFCIKAGQAQFAKLLEHFPERYKFHEDWEEEMRERFKDRPGERSILTDQKGGKKQALPLKELRRRIEAREKFDEFDFGGCACGLPAAAEEDEP